MNNIKEIIRECVMRGIRVEMWKHESSVDGLCYVVDRFAKSGNARVFENVEGVIEVHTRYNQVDFIESFDDLARLCFVWCSGYIDRGYGYGNWVTTFEEYGWVKSVTKATWEST